MNTHLLLKQTFVRFLELDKYPLYYSLISCFLNVEVTESSNMH